MTNLTTIDNFSMVGLDDIDDFSSLSVISNEGLIKNQPRDRLSLNSKMFSFEFADGTMQPYNELTMDVVIINASSYQSRIKNSKRDHPID
jgi:hypothetical protein